MNAFPRERLTSELGADGKWHARYATGSVTLCGRPTVGAQKGRKYPPDCGLCGKTARTFDRVDGSMPDHWRLPADLSPPRRDFLAERVRQLEQERGRLTRRVTELEASRDLWRHRAQHKKTTA